MRRRVAFVLIFVAAAALPAAGVARAARWRWPVRGEVITGFQVSHAPFARGQHRGVDIAASVGTPVRAACGGRVRFAGVLPGGVGAVSIVCGGLIATYLQVRDPAVSAGMTVPAGTRLGVVAPSRDPRVPRAHLHLGARLEAAGRSRYRNPLELLAPAPGAPVAPFRPTGLPARPGVGPRLPPLPPALVPVPVRPSPRPAPAAPRTAGTPVLAWVGLALVAGGLPVGVLAQGRRRHRARTAALVAQGGPAGHQ